MRGIFYLWIYKKECFVVLYEKIHCLTILFCFITFLLCFLLQSVTSTAWSSALCVMHTVASTRASSPTKLARPPAMLTSMSQVTFIHFSACSSTETQGASCKIQIWCYFRGSCTISYFLSLFRIISTTKRSINGTRWNHFWQQDLKVFFLYSLVIFLWMKFVQKCSRTVEEILQIHNSCSTDGIHQAETSNFWQIYRQRQIRIIYGPLIPLWWLFRYPPWPSWWDSSDRIHHR